MIGMEYGTVQCTDSNFYKSVCLFQCGNGYFMSGDSTLTCGVTETLTHDWDQRAPTCIAKCTADKFDIALVIDSSSSIGDESFDLIKKFLTRLVQQFDIGFDKTQFMAVRYNKEVYDLWGFQEYDTAEALVEQINNIPYDGVGTRTGKALRQVRHSFHHAGKPVGRADSVKMVMVLTDGNSDDDSTAAAQVLKDKNVYVNVVGVGNIDRVHLAEMASDPKESYTVFIESYNSLSSRTNHIVSRLRQCNKINCTPSTSVLDLVVMVDTSSSIGQENFIIVQDFLSNIFGNFPIGIDDTRIALITYNNHVNIKFKLNQFASKREILQEIAKVEYEGVGTLTGQAMVETAMKIFENDAGRRTDIPTVTVLITDGKSQDPVENPAKHLQTLSRVIAVGIGSEADQKELQEIASGEGDENVYHAQSFATLNSLHEILATSIASSCSSY